MACQGPVLTKYFPGHGVITLTFRQLQNIVFDGSAAAPWGSTSACCGRFDRRSFA